VVAAYTVSFFCTFGAFNRTEWNILIPICVELPQYCAVFNTPEGSHVFNNTTLLALNEIGDTCPVYQRITTLRGGAIQTELILIKTCNGFLVRLMDCVIFYKLSFVSGMGHKTGGYRPYNERKIITPLSRKY
jgi:hypothetical protein